MIGIEGFGWYGGPQMNLDGYGRGPGIDLDGVGGYGMSGMGIEGLGWVRTASDSPYPSHLSQAIHTHLKPSTYT